MRGVREAEDSRSPCHHRRAPVAHGRGTYTYADGDKYEGSFENGRQHGTGRYTHRSGKISEGLWESGRLVQAQQQSAADESK